jgi:DNA-directed RNA polymerase sigma subunit (sigma70/sigma32)
MNLCFCPNRTRGLEHHADRSNPDHEEGSLVSNQALVAKVVALLAKTDKRAAQVISLRFGLGPNDWKTLKEVGAELGLTRERIRQIETEALDSLREIIRSKGLL